MENQLIVYTPKKNIKKIIKIIFLGILISIVVFLLTVICSVSVFSKLKWNETTTYNNRFFIEDQKML